MADIVSEFLNRMRGAGRGVQQSLAGQAAAGGYGQPGVVRPPVGGIAPTARTPGGLPTEPGYGSYGRASPLPRRGGSPIGIRRGVGIPAQPSAPFTMAEMGAWPPNQPQRPTFRPNMRMGFPGANQPPGADPRAWQGRFSEMMNQQRKTPTARAMPQLTQGRPGGVLARVPQLPPTPGAAVPGTEVARVAQIFSSGQGTAGGGGGGAGGGRPGGGLGGYQPPRQGPVTRIEKHTDPGKPPPAGRGGGYFSSWTRDPFKIYRDSKATFQPKAVIGPTGQPTGEFTKFPGMRGRAPRMFAGLGALGPGLNVAFVGTMLGVPSMFDEGGKGDVVAEGALVGASLGAPFGPVGALAGGALGTSLNIITGGAFADMLQASPLGFLWGGTEQAKMDMRKVAESMYNSAAATQGLGPEAATASVEAFEGFMKMIEGGMIPEEQTYSMMMMAGRMGGLKGVPWSPEDLTPVYSADDIKAITESVSSAMLPAYDVARGLMEQEFEFITDEKIRGELVLRSQQMGTDIIEGVVSGAGVPGQTAVLTESARRQTNEQLGQDLFGGGASDEFMDLLGGAVG